MKWSDVYSPDALSRVDFEERAAARRHGNAGSKHGLSRANAGSKHHEKAERAAVAGAEGNKLVPLASVIAAVALLAFVVVPVTRNETVSVPLQSAHAAPETASDVAEAEQGGCSTYDIRLDAEPLEASVDGPSSEAAPAYVYGTGLTGNDWSDVTSADFVDKSIDEKVELIGAMAHDDEVLTGIPAELTAAQAILESGWMNSGLSREHENYFGIKASSEGYNWDGSTWDGRTDGSVAVMATQEEYEEGVITDIEDGFRVYDGLWDSIRDHSAYLLNSGLYDGIEDAADIEDVIDMVVDGGYATSSSYKEMLLEIIGTYGLERFVVR